MANKNSAAYVIIVFPEIVYAIHIQDFIKYKGKTMATVEASSIARYGVAVSEL